MSSTMLGTDNQRSEIDVTVNLLKLGHVDVISLYKIYLPCKW